MGTTITSVLNISTSIDPTTISTFIKPSTVYSLIQPLFIKYLKFCSNCTVQSFLYWYYYYYFISTIILLMLIHFAMIHFIYSHILNIGDVTSGEYYLWCMFLGGCGIQKNSRIKALLEVMHLNHSYIQMYFFQNQI